MKFSRLGRLIVPAMALMLFNGCGGGDDNDEEVARIVDLFFEQPTVQVGQTARLLVDFSFARERVQEDNDHVIVKLSLPAGTVYQENSAEIDGNASDDDVDPESVDRCLDGSSVVTFDFNDDDLFDVDDPEGDADGTLKLSVTGISAVGPVTVEGRAGYNVVSGSCNDDVIPEAAVVLTVTR